MTVGATETSSTVLLILLSGIEAVADTLVSGEFFFFFSKRCADKIHHVYQNEEI